MLLALEASGAEVYYAAPAFHQPDELNDAFLNGQVRTRSLWVRPSQIGPLPDTREHHVSFERVANWAFFSDPRRLEGPRSFEDVALSLARGLKLREGRPAREEVVGLAKKLEAIARLRHDVTERHFAVTREGLKQESPLRTVAQYASFFLDCQFVLVQRALPNVG
jgi:hypothetical protein